MVEMLLGGKALQHWRQFKSQAMDLLILGVHDEDDDESSGEDKDDEEKKDKGQSSTSAGTPAVITKDTYSSICCKDPEALSLKTKGFGNPACSGLTTGNQQYVAIFPQPLNSKLPEDELVEIVLQLIPAGWKRTMMCANFKPLKNSMEELVEYLKGVKHLETKNHLERNNRNNNNSSSLKKTKKGKHKHGKDKKSQDITDNTVSSKKSHKHCKLCKMFGGNAELHTTD
eukprot:12976190-Ditylum_brightwellii.AAC.1